MGLPARQRRVLDRTEDAIRGTDPRLAAMFAIFGRLTQDEEMPRAEQLRHHAAITGLRLRLWFGAPRWGGRRRRRVRPRLPLALLFPAALLIMTVTIVVVARFGSAPKCAATTPAAAAKPHPRGKTGLRTRGCSARVFVPALSNR
jgi:hypothetical protein